MTRSYPKDRRGGCGVTATGVSFGLQLKDAMERPSLEELCVGTLRLACVRCPTSPYGGGGASQRPYRAAFLLPPLVPPITPPGPDLALPVHPEREVVSGYPSPRNDSPVSTWPMPFRWLTGVSVPNASLRRVKGRKPQTDATKAPTVTLRPNGGIIGGVPEKQSDGRCDVAPCGQARNTVPFTPHQRGNRMTDWRTDPRVQEARRQYDKAGDDFTYALERSADPENDKNLDLLLDNEDGCFDALCEAVAASGPEGEAVASAQPAMCECGHNAAHHTCLSSTLEICPCCEFTPAEVRPPDLRAAVEGMSDEVAWAFANDLDVCNTEECSFDLSAAKRNLAGALLRAGAETCPSCKAQHPWANKHWCRHDFHTERPDTTPQQENA